MNLVDLSSAAMKDAPTVLIQHETLRAPRVSTFFVCALPGILGLPVVYVLDNVAGTALCKVGLR